MGHNGGGEKALQAMDSEFVQQAYENGYLLLSRWTIITRQDRGALEIRGV